MRSNATNYQNRTVKELFRSTEKKIQTVISVRTAIRILLFVSVNAVAVRAHTQPKIEFEILKSLQKEYDQCLLSNSVFPKERFLSSVLSAIRTDVKDTITLLWKIKLFTPEDEWDYVSQELIDRNHTYWKPYIECDSTSSTPSGPYPAIAKPIIFQDQKKALVIAYMLTKKSQQSVIMMEYVENEWEVKHTVVSGFYL